MQRTFTLQITADDRPGMAPVGVRVRMALKHMLRSLSLRCVSISEVRTSDPELDELFEEVEQ